jgi:hypothetical protein
LRSPRERPFTNIGAPEAIPKNECGDANIPKHRNSTQTSKVKTVFAFSVTQAIRPAANQPTAFDGRHHYSTYQIHPLRKLSTPAPGFPFFAGPVNTAK